MNRTTVNILWSAIVVVLLMAAYMILHDRSRQQTLAPTRHNYRITIPVSPSIAAQTILKANEGDTVTLAISSDRPGTLYVHGYEKKILLHPHHVALLTFTADRAGSFDLHLHDPDGQMHGLAELEVHPR